MEQKDIYLILAAIMIVALAFLCVSMMDETAGMCAAYCTNMGMERASYSPGSCQCYRESGKFLVNGTFDIVDFDVENDT